MSPSTFNPGPNVKRIRLPILWLLLISALGLAAVGCGLTVTNERPTYDELDPPEKAAVDVIITELTAFNAQVTAHTSATIAGIIDKEKIDVSFEGVFFTGNLGDGVVHVATWENLTANQRLLIQQWFKEGTEAAAKARYEKFFYRFMAVSEGVKEFMYQELGRDWVYVNRSLFNMQRDSIRTALSHFRDTGRRGEIWDFLNASCVPVKSQYESLYAAKFSKQYLRDHTAEILNPENPTPYMYFICRWIDLGFQDSVGLGEEFAWLSGLDD